MLIVWHYYLIIIPYDEHTNIIFTSKLINNQFSVSNLKKKVILGQASVEANLAYHQPDKTTMHEKNWHPHWQTVLQPNLDITVDVFFSL